MWLTQRTRKLSFIILVATTFGCADPEVVSHKLDQSDAHDDVSEASVFETIDSATEPSADENTSQLPSARQDRAGGLTESDTMPEIASQRPEQPSSKAELAEVERARDSDSETTPKPGEVESFDKVAVTESTEAIDTKQVAAVVERVFPSVEAALVRYDKHSALPSKVRFYDFVSETKSSNNEKFVADLDTTRDGLGFSEWSGFLDRIEDQRETIRKTRSYLSDYRKEMISAPESSRNPFTTTKEGYEKKIATAEKMIESAKDEISSIKSELAEHMAALGIEVDADVVDQLLESMTGNDLVSLCVAWQNMKHVVEQLKELTDESDEDLQAAKKYYGMHLILLMALDRAQKKFIAEIDAVYYPKLEEFAARAQGLIKEAEDDLGNGLQSEVLIQNINSNKLTLTLARAGQSELRTQQQQIRSSNEALAKEIRIAENTYKTVALSTEIAGVISLARERFEALSRLETPELRQFQNSRLAELSRQMRMQDLAAK